MPGPPLTANVTVADDFLVVFARVDESTWRVGLHKAERRSIGADVRAGIDVSFADADAIAAMLDGVVEGVLATPMAQIASVLSKATLAGLNDAERALVKTLIARLGLDASRRRSTTSESGSWAQTENCRHDSRKSSKSKISRSVRVRILDEWTRQSICCRRHSRASASATFTTS